MTKQSLLDPFSFWKRMYEHTESNYSETIHNMLNTEQYAAFLGQLQGTFLPYQQLVQKTTNAYLKQINVPTNEDLSRIASLVIHLEEKVESIDEAISDQSTSTEIMKLKTTVSNLEKKMDQILDILTNKEMPSATYTTSTNS